VLSSLIIVYLRLEDLDFVDWVEASGESLAGVEIHLEEVGETGNSVGGPLEAGKAGSACQACQALVA